MSFRDYDVRTPGRSFLTSLARFVQFRSELAILAVLGGGVVFGAVVRQVLPGSAGPSAGIAAPPARRIAPAPTPTHAPRPADTQDAAPQLVRPQ